MGAYKIGTGEGNKVLSLGTSGAFDDERCLHPCVVEQGTNVYLFYSGYDGANYSIGVANTTVSGFTGVNFTKYGFNPVLTKGSTGAWDAAGVWAPWVYYDGTTWHMWYTGMDASGVQRIGYATATGPYGIWTKHANNPVLAPGAAWEGSIAAEPCVLKDGATWRMLYHGNEPASSNARIGYATASAPEGPWTKEASPVLEPAALPSEWMGASVFSPRTFEKHGSTYYLYFSAKNTGAGMSQIGAATSSDCLTWTLAAANPLISASRDWEVSTQGETEHGNHYWDSTAGIHYVFYDAWFGDIPTIGAIRIEATS